MAIAGAKRPMFNADGVSPAGNTHAEAQVRDAAGTVLKADSAPSGPAGSPYSIPLPLTAAQAAAATGSRTRVIGAGGPGEWLELGAPAGGFTPTLPGLPTDGTITN